MYQNTVHLIGYLGNSPEQKSAKQTGRKYTVFSLATKRAWKGADDQWHSKTEWHRVIAWNGVGEYAAAKLRKGDHVYIEGTLVSSSYEREIGKGKKAAKLKLTSWSIRANVVRKLNRRENQPEAASAVSSIHAVGATVESSAGAPF
jgi:single stranded DNA-binding protein